MDSMLRADLLEFIISMEECISSPDEEALTADDEALEAELLALVDMEDIIEDIDIDDAAGPLVGPLP